MGPVPGDRCPEEPQDLSARGRWQLLRIMERLRAIAEPESHRPGDPESFFRGMQELLRVPIRQEALDRIRAVAQGPARSSAGGRARRMILAPAILGLVSLGGIPANSLLVVGQCATPPSGGSEAPKSPRSDFGATDSAVGRVMAIVDEVGRPTSRNGNLEAGEPPVRPGAAPESSIGVEQPAGSTESQLGAGAQPVLGFESESDSATDGAVTPRRRQ